MKCFLKAAACLTLFTAAVAVQAQGLDLVDPAYIYAQQPRKNINWLYIGFVPRMEDNKRVKVVLSKAGFTMRVSMEMTPQEVIDYPGYLVRRYDQVKALVDANGVEIFQQQRFAAYATQIAAIRAAIAAGRQDMQSQYEFGMGLLKQFYPQNIFEIVEGGSVARIEAHFIYPITIHKSITWPRPGVYRPYIVEERRSFYSKAASSIFGGFPAFWLDPAGAGTGVHGPIRYANAGDGRQDGNTGRMRAFWAENNFLNEPMNPVENLEPTYRWDLVRTNDSHGCFRAEPLELRHLLPSDPHKILDDNKTKLNLGTGPGIATREIDYDSVTFDIRAEYDRLSVQGHFENRIVDVDYYLTNPYKKADKTAWLKARMLTKQERNDPQWETTLMTKMTEEIQTFPYLDPGALEFASSNGGPALSLMTKFNQAH